MNIFVTDSDPIIAAQNLCDSHVIKMIVESCQLLSTHDILNGYKRIYKPTHNNHPCRICLNNPYNYMWLILHLKGLLDEYRYRYYKIHKCLELYNIYWKNINYTYNFEQTTFPSCMPKEYQIGNVIKNYRAYYKFKRKDLCRFTYKNRNIPNWLNEDY